jgi:hypothetical protein
MASARGVSLCAPRLADPFRSLLPHSDPLGEPRQVGTGRDAQRGLECLALPLVPVLAGVEAKRDPGPFGQQVAAAVRNLPQLGYRGLDVQRLPAHIAANSAGELGRGDPVRVGSAAGDSHGWDGTANRTSVLELRSFEVRLRCVYKCIHVLPELGVATARPGGRFKDECAGAIPYDML